MPVSKLEIKRGEIREISITLDSGKVLSFTKTMPEGGNVEIESDDFGGELSRNDARALGRALIDMANEMELKEGDTTSE